MGAPTTSVVAGSQRHRPVRARRVTSRRSAGTASYLGVETAHSSRCPIGPAAGPRAGSAPAVAHGPGAPEEESLARRAQRQPAARRTGARDQRRVRDRDNDGIIPVLARAVREVEDAAERGSAMAPVRQVPGDRAARARGARPGQGRRPTAPRRTGPSSSSASTASPRSWPRRPRATPPCWPCSPRTPSSPTRPARCRRDMLAASGAEPDPEVEPERRGRASARLRAPGGAAVGRLAPARQPVPRPRLRRRRAEPRPAPAAGRLGAARAAVPVLRVRRQRRPPAWRCPSRVLCGVPEGLELMPHQARLVGAAAAGHRTFLLADEPGLGKTAQALLAAQAANAYPLLVVVPNVVKTNWAREAQSVDARTARPPWCTATARPIDGFADIVIVNYEVLDRHIGWLGDLGFRGMVVDEAHFIKNKKLPALPARPAALRADPVPDRPAAADGADRHPADQRHRGLPGDLAVPRLDRRQEAARRADGRPGGGRPDPARPGLLLRRAQQRGRPRHRAPPQGRRGRRHPRPPDRGPSGRARRRGRPLDPRGRARAGPAGWCAATTRALARPAGPATWSRASTTSSSAGSPTGSREDTDDDEVAGRTSSR